MSDVLEQARAAREQGNWALLDRYLQQLPLGQGALAAGVEPEALNDRDLEQVLNLALALLEFGDFQERWDVAKLFPKIGTIAIAPLIEILADGEAEVEVRWFAGRILGEFNHPNAIAALVNLLRTADDEDLAAMAANALSNLGSHAIDALTDLLASPETRWLATTALSQIRRPEIVEPLLGVVRDSDMSVRAVAIEALSSFHDSRIPPILLEALNDRGARVRKEAVIGLGLRTDLWDELDLLNRLKPLLYDFNPDVCQQAAIALGRSAKDEAAEALFNVITSPATPVPLKIEFIRALGWIRTTKALDYLQQALAHVSVEGVQEIVRALGHTEEPVFKQKAAQILIDFLNSGHPARQTASVKQAIAQAWGQLGEEVTIDALVALLADPAPSVKLHAIAALKNFPAAYQQLEQLSDDEALTPALKEGVAIALAEWKV
ncbi:MAG TPA: HEAT repeat domain-containing protein [Allocoleopsis sp.]